MKIGILARNEAELEAALAKDLKLPITQAEEGYDFVLAYIAGHLCLASPKHEGYKPFSIDFLSADTLHRLKTGLNKSELLIKAVGAAGKERPRVLDCTLGLGQDSLLLAAWELDVTVCERNPIVRALWVDARRRAEENSRFKEIFSRITLWDGDALAAIQSKGKWDTIYLDPMYPEDEKRTALPKKEMVLFRDLLGKDEDASEVFLAARAHHAKRIAVKRQLSAPVIHPDYVPSMSYTGKAVRFDVYLATT
jgi:16S rRNA (guanine1516-N2)-methyltransferase